MPWEEVNAVDQRFRFVQEAASGLYTMTELCELYGISRTTGYKWVLRYAEEGVAGLEDRSRAPHSCPDKVQGGVAEALLALRRKHPSWGPKKLLPILHERQPDWHWPRLSTVSAFLKREGLVKPRRRRKRPVHPGKPRLSMEHPNQVWSADFKGQFRTGDRRYCYPLTVCDGATRYLLACKALEGTQEAPSRRVFERVFRQYGLPEAMLTDNGVPFASQGLAGLSRLSVWWVKLGIRPVRIEPGKPQQNGRHERMHKTLKEQTARPPAANRRAQQRSFDRFLREYNEERPHEALGQQPPARLYARSPRPYPAKPRPLEYPGHFEVRRVSSNGGIRWHNGYLFVSQVLAKENVGMEEVDDGIWSLYFGPIHLGRFDEREVDLRLEPDRMTSFRVSTMYSD